MESKALRQFFRFLNRFFMAPVFRLGLGPFMGNPLSGYIMVLKTVGRKSGKLRYSPVNYAILGGYVYCLAGFGQVAHWYRNLLAKPQIEAILPGGAIAGVAERVDDAAEGLRVARQILRNSGFAGFLAGLNAFRVTDAELEEKTKDYPVIRIRPTGIGSGAGDAGGWLWVLGVMVTVLLLWLILR